MSWLKPLAEIITFKGGGTPSKQVPEYWNGNIPWATVKDFKSTTLSETQEAISFEGLNHSSANLIPKGHVIIPTRMALGKAAINSIDLAINQDLKALIPKVDIDSNYLLYAVLTLAEEIIKNGSGATVKGITQENLYKLKIPLPPLDNQIRIAHLLSKVEGLIAQRKENLQQLDDLLKSVFLEMFGDCVNDNGESTLEDCIKIQQGFAFKSEEFIESGVPIIKIGTVNKGYFDYSTLSFIAEGYPKKLARFEISAGDLLISLTGTVGKDDYGNTCFVPRNSNYPVYLLNQRVGKLICNTNIANPVFVDFFLRMPKVKAALIKNNRGVRQANLSSNDIYSLQLTIPAIDLQNEFAAIVEKAKGIKFQYQQSLAELENLYGDLSQKAFKGELDLSRVVVSYVREEMSRSIPATGQGGGLR